MNSLINTLSASHSFLWPAFILCPVPDLFALRLHRPIKNTIGVYYRPLFVPLTRKAILRLWLSGLRDAVQPAQPLIPDFLIFTQVKDCPRQAEESQDKLIADCLINVEQGIERAKE
jgi:hypothetical protein